MLIYRYETFEIYPDSDQTIEDVKGLLEKTQDLEIDNYEIVENSQALTPFASLFRETEYDR